MPPSLAFLGECPCVCCRDCRVHHPYIIKKTQSLADQKYDKTTQFLFSDAVSPSQVSQAVLAAPLLWRELSLHIRDWCEIFCNCSYLQTMQTASDHFGREIGNSQICRSPENCIYYMLCY